MGVIVADFHKHGDTELRKVYCSTLMELAAEDERVCVLDADLMNASATKPFAAAFPENTFDCGVQEANMLGVAAGLSATGQIPFTHTFAPFAARRACDQIFVSCAYAKQNVKIVGSDPGITTALNGGTHMPFEDIAIMRSIPEITVVEPADAVAVREVVRMAKEAYGVWYIRLHRKTAPAIYEAGTTFEVGKANLLRDGKDVTIIAMGFCVAEALKAAELLEKEGIQARVLDMFCVKPLDEAAVIRAAQETGAVVTAENHNVINGLGSAVADVLASSCWAPLEKVGVQDEFGEVGPVDYLQERFGLTAQAICEKAKKAIARK